MLTRQLISEGRAKLGLNVRQFTDRCGVSRGAVQQWEKEGGTAPSRKHAPYVAGVLGLTVSELMGGKAGVGPGTPAASGAGYQPSPLGLALAQLFDGLPDDLVIRAKAFNRASTAIISCDLPPDVQASDAPVVTAPVQKQRA